MAGRAKRTHRDPHEFLEWLHAASVGGRLNRRVAYASGNWAALHDALIQAMTDEDARKGQRTSDPVTVPRWVLEALLHQLLRPYLSTSKQCKQWRKRYRKDLIDWERYCQVMYRSIDDYDAANLSREQKRQRRIAAREHVIKTKSRWSGIDTSVRYPWSASSHDSDLTIFEAAAAILKGGPYAGSPSTMRASWATVTKAIESGDIARYYPSRWFKFKGHIRSTEDMDPR